jgi:hypothetical protein
MKKYIILAILIIAAAASLQEEKNIEENDIEKNNHINNRNEIKDPRNVYLYCLRVNLAVPSCFTTPAECNEQKKWYGKEAGQCKPIACGTTQTIGYTAMCEKNGF